MTIYFNPLYDSSVFLKAEDCDTKVLMDQQVVSTPGLLNILALRLGLHFEPQQQNEALARYYEAMKKAMPKLSNSVLAKSFENSGLATANAVLHWRDELRLAGCKFNKDDAGRLKSNRLKTIFAIEEEYRQVLDKTDIVDQLEAVLTEMAAQHLDCSCYELRLPFDLKLFRPLEKKLLTSLKNRGAKISFSLIPVAGDADDNLSKVRRMLIDENKDKITLAPQDQDESLLVFEFADEHAAHEYLSFNDMSNVDVWINPDNKQMDNWLYRLDKPMAGSQTSDGMPQILQLFVMGISLFRNPLDINTFIEWLNVENQPLPRNFRSVLARTIAKTGGYRNDKCKEIVEKYINGDYECLTAEEKALPEIEQSKLRMKDKKNRQNLVELYLPGDIKDGPIDVAQLRKFTDHLSSWASQRAVLQKDDIYGDQYRKLQSMIETFQLLLTTVSAGQIDQATLDSWMSIIYKPDGSCTNTFAQQGSCTVVASPAQLISIADRTVWMNVDGETSAPMQLDFLYPSEKTELEDKKLIDIWDEVSQNKWHQDDILAPFRHTRKQLVIVTCLHRGGEATQRHPLIVRMMQQIENYDSIVCRPTIEPASLEKVEPLVKKNYDGVMQINSVAESKFPDHESPTSMESIICHPLDYVMGRIADITPDEKAQLSDIGKTKGNVAHGVIEALFAPRNGQLAVKADEIADRIKKEYDDVFLRIVESKGATLQLRENQLECQLLRRQLLDCLTVLLDIIRSNNLSVKGCEHGCNFKYIHGDIDIHGVIDMTLEDVKHHPVVFDFKWTSSKSYHRELLEKDRSIQLETYRDLLSKEIKDEVKSVAYFIMPEAHLYSKEVFVSNHCTQITAVKRDAFMAQLLNSIAYRKEQLAQGHVEMPGAFEDLEYVTDTQSKELFPLEKDKATGKQTSNKFSNYKLFQ